jgi:hypothetical protein
MNGVTQRKRERNAGRTVSWQDWITWEWVKSLYLSRVRSCKSFLCRIKLNISHHHGPFEFGNSNKLYLVRGQSKRRIRCLIGHTFILEQIQIDQLSFYNYRKYSDRIWPIILSEFIGETIFHGGNSQKNIDIREVPHTAVSEYLRYYLSYSNTFLFGSISTSMKCFQLSLDFKREIKRWALNKAFNYMKKF